MKGIGGGSSSGSKRLEGGAVLFTEMHTPGRLGRSFVATLCVGILFGFGFAYVLLNINNTTPVQQSALSFFQPQQIRFYN